jgi:hypothetical protein
MTIVLARFGAVQAACPTLLAEVTADPAALPAVA